MHKIFLILAFTLLLVINAFGQAAVDILLLATAVNNNFPLSVGLDLTATNCIDPQLGESALPSPPPGVTELRLDLYPYGCGPISTCKDYRAPGNPPTFPFTGIIEHTLIYMLSIPASPIDITYDIPSGVFLSITDHFGGVILNLGPFNGQGTTTIPGSYTNSFNDALIIMEYNNIIPVVLISFTASFLQNEKAVRLKWTTATETNNSGFEIEKKNSGVRSQETEWKKIGFVPGFGTTAEPKSYSYIDENVSSGNYKYRLKQIDFDGTFTYSKEIEFEVDFTPKEFVLYQNYPNPFNPTTKISWQSPVSSWQTLKVYDVLGNEIAILINEEKPVGEYEVEFNSHSGEVRNLPSGVYFYHLCAGKHFKTMKMVILK